SLHHHATPPSDNPDTLLPFYTPHFTTSHFFFFNDTATTEIYTLSLHDALPIFGVKIFSRKGIEKDDRAKAIEAEELEMMEKNLQDRKSTRLNSSHVAISYAVFCLKKKKKNGN